MDTFKVKHSHGTTEFFATYEEACEAVRSVYREAVIGHDGDISEGGESTLCWPDEPSSVDDDGVRACAKIVRQHDLGRATQAGAPERTLR